MKRWIGIAFVITLSAFAGCRTNGYCGSCGSGVVIPPPPTYSVNAPRTGQQNGFNGRTAANTTLLNPAGSAPTPSQGGWQSPSAANFSLGTSTTQPAPGNQTPTINGQRNSVLEGASNVGPNSANGQANTRIANGNFRTTVVDERFDNTRLVATDASLVRAPAPAGPAFSAPRIPQTPTFVQGQAVLVSGNPSQYQSYSQAPTLVTRGLQQYPAVSNVAYGTNSPEVLGQSTATFTPESSDGYRNGWRDANIY